MIRQAQPADAEAVATLIGAAYGGYAPLLGRNPQPMDDDYAALIAAKQVFVLEDGGELLGVLVVQQPDDFELLVRTVGIAPTHQGKGLGTQLMTYAEQVASDRDINRLRLYTNEVMDGTARLYTRLGYEETRREGPEGRQVIYMAKEVPFDRTPWYGVIVTDPDTCFGKVRITGTRHYIDFLLAMIEGGYSFDYILAEYPQLERAQLEAMMGFVRDLVAAKRNGLKGDIKHG